MPLRRRRPWTQLKPLSIHKISFCSAKNGEEEDDDEKQTNEATTLLAL